MRIRFLTFFIGIGVLSLFLYLPQKGVNAQKLQVCNSDFFKKDMQCLKEEEFAQEVNRFLTIFESRDCAYLGTKKYQTFSNLFNKNPNAIYEVLIRDTNNCNIVSSMEEWIRDNCGCDGSVAASSVDNNGIWVDRNNYQNVMVDRVVEIIQQGKVSISGTPVPTPAASIPIPTSIPTPAPTKLDDLTITANLHISKCGLAETGYQCCYPNLKSDTASFVGDFLNNFGALWDTVKTFIGENINSMLQIGTADLNNAITSGGNIPNLCPRSEEGPRKERFVQLEQNNQQEWLDQNENYDGQNENYDGQNERDSLEKQELENYASLLYGETVSSLDERNFSDNDGIVGKILKSTAIPSDGISHENSKYACFCVNTENEVDKTPEYFLNLPENKVFKINQSSYIIKNSSSVSSEGKQVAGAVLEARTQDSAFDPFDISANKFCRNIGNDTEEGMCKECVKSINGGGAWTALGCIPANFNGALETLFPIIISFAGLISLGCIIYASFLLQTSMGEPEKIGKAQELMTSCITGLIMIIFSIFILRVIGFDILRLPGFGDGASSPTPTSTLTTTTVPPTAVPPTATPGPANTPGPTNTAIPTSAPTPTPTENCASNSFPKPGQIYIYDGENHGGKCIIINRDVPNLKEVKNNDMWPGFNLFGHCNSSFNDCVSSIKVGEKTKVRLFRDIDFDISGNYIDLEEGMTTLGNFKDIVSSIQFLDY